MFIVLFVSDSEWISGSRASKLFDTFGYLFVGGEAARDVVLGFQLTGRLKIDGNFMAGGLLGRMRPKQPTRCFFLIFLK